MSTNERALTARVGALLRRQPDVWYLKTQSQGFQRVGVPDFLGCAHGQFFAIELKSPRAPRATPDPRQQLELDALQRAGALTLCTNQFTEVQLFLERLLHHA